MDIGSEELLRKKVRALMRQHEITQIELARRLRKSQPWLSRKLSGGQKFLVRDLDQLAACFRITVPELFFDAYGQWDRRSGTDRRKGERRKQQQRIYDHNVDLSPETARLGFPTDEDR